MSVRHVAASIITDIMVEEQDLGMLVRGITIAQHVPKLANEMLRMAEIIFEHEGMLESERAARYDLLRVLREQCKE